MMPYSFDYAPIPIIRLHRWNKVGISAYLIIEPILSFWFHLYMKDIKTAMQVALPKTKTRFYCKPNLMQCNTSFVILDPKGEILRDTGKLLESKGYEVRVLDLISMEKSHCYNPFVYLQNDNDVQKLVRLKYTFFFIFIIKE